MEWRASFPMYDFPWLLAAHETLWRCIARSLRGRGFSDVPRALTHDDDVHALWRQPAMLLSQACGWPLVDELDGKVATIGAFEYDVPSAVGPTYCSWIVVRDGEELPRAERLAQLIAAVNSDVSLSGWISLVQAFPELGGVWPGGVLATGTHGGSLAALRAGEADIAAIDAVSWEHFSRGHPELVAGLVVVGEGPRIPCLPLIGSMSLSDQQVAGIRSAIAEALGSPDGAAAAESLLIKRFFELDYSDYQPLQAMSSRRS